MLVLGYVIFLLLSYFLVLQIFRLSTYHGFFAKSLPLLIGYSVGVGFAFYSMPHFHSFFFTQIWGSGLLFILTWLRQVRRGRMLLETTAENPEQLAIINLSVASTRAYYILSATIYLLVFALSFLAFYNFRQA